MIKCIVADKYIVINENVFLNFLDRFNYLNNTNTARNKHKTRFKKRFALVYLGGITQYNKYYTSSYALQIQTGALKGKILIPLVGDLIFYENMNKINKLLNSSINLISLESSV